MWRGRSRYCTISPLASLPEHTHTRRVASGVYADTRQRSGPIVADRWEVRRERASSVRSAAFTTRLQQSPVSCFVSVGLRSCGCACASGICGAYTVSCSCVGSLSLESALVITPTMIVSVIYIIVTILKLRNFLIKNLFRFIILFIYTCSV